MNPICRLTAAVAGLAGALLAVAAVAPAALAGPFPPRPPGWDKHPPLPPPGAGIHVVVVGGMPGWQIALIAIGAALLAATAAAGIIAKRGGSPVWRPRAKVSASAPPAGPPGTSWATGPSPAAARTQRHMPPRRRPRPRPVLATGEEHRVPGRQETTHVHTHSPPGTLPAGSSATGRRATVPARRGPFFRNRRARFFTLALPALSLVIFASVFTGTTKVAGGSIDTSLYYVPVIITLAIISAASGNPGLRPGLLLLNTPGGVMLMKTPFRRRRSLLAGSALAVMLTVGLIAVAPELSSPANAQSGPSCADPVTSAPTGPATVSAAWIRYGKVLVVGSGGYTGCSLYLLTSDQLHALTGAPFACSDNTNATGSPCDTVLWPALLTNGAPIAGRGVNPALLGTVTRTDLPGLRPVQQVTYAGLPLYRFFQDETPGETEGANLFDPVTSPTGIWYLVQPSRGRPAPGQAQLQLESAPVGGTGPGQTVLAATMNPDFSGFPQARFPVYTLSRDHHKSACQGVCAAVYWPPVLTSKRPLAGPGVDRHALGIIVRPDGSRQVTYNGRPLYLFYNDAYIPGLPYNGGTASINGAGAHTPWGVFNTIPPLP